MITKLDTDLNIVQSMDDEPNDTTGLTAAQLKGKFDEAGNDIKTYINNVLTVDMDSLTDVQNTSISGANTKADNAVTTANDASTKADSAISTANIADSKSDDAVNTSNVSNGKADDAVTTANSAVTIAGNAVTTANGANTTALAVQTDYSTQKPIMLQAVSDVNLKVDKTYVDAAVASFALGAIPDKGIVSSMFSDDINNTINDKATNEELATTNGNVSTNTENIATNVGAISVNAQNIETNTNNLASHLTDNTNSFALKIDKAGGQFTGIIKAQSNTSNTVSQIHNTILNTTDAVLASMSDGDIWIKYV